MMDCGRKRTEEIIPAGIHPVIGDADILEALPLQPPYAPFAEETLHFLGQWSLKIRTALRKTGGAYPDAAAFAFWCRRAGLEQKKAEYGDAAARRLGLGVSLHYAASNVPVLFAFSAAAALLAGNCVLLRLPAKKTPQEAILCDALLETFEQLPDWKNRVVFFRSEKDRAANAYLAGKCQVRIIWGGDRTVREIRAVPLPVRAREITFPDRGSAAILSAEAVLEAEESALPARDFFNDTYLNDQNACSSPRILCWLGGAEQIEAARRRFWNSVCRYAAEYYPLTDVIAIKKTEQAYVAAVLREDAKICFYGTPEIAPADTPADESAPIPRGNIAVCVWLDTLDASCWDLCVPGGFFLETGGKTPECLFPVLTEKCQTVTCFGVDAEALGEEILKRRLSGADRIVPFGHAMDFSLLWDGHDLIREMSREISYQ